MTRHKSGAKAMGAKGRGIEILLQTGTSFDEQPADAQPNKKTPKSPKKKRGRPKKQVPQPIELSYNENEDDLAQAEPEPPQGQSLSLEIAPHKVQLAELFNNLGFAALDFLTSLKNAKSVSSFLLSCGLAEDDENVGTVEELCSTISQMLRSGRAPKVKVKTTMCAPGSLLPMHSFFVHRGVSNILSLAAPMEIFKATASIKNKTFGFIREKGEYTPLMCALSGVDNVVEPSKKMLDSDVWTYEVYRLGTFRDHTMRRSRYESKSGLPKGYTFCSHVEPKLMLWFACRWLVKVTRDPILAGSIKKQVSNIFRTSQRGMPDPPEAELLLDRLPCTSCKDFRTEMEEVTGIKFLFHYIPKVGNVYLQKDAYNNQVFPLCADENDVLSSSDEADEEEELANRLQSQALLRPKAPTLKSVLPALPSNEAIRVNKSTSITKIKKYTYSCPAKGGAWRPDRQPYIEEEEEEEEEEEVYTPTPARKKKPTSPSKRKSGISSPSPSPKRQQTFR